MHTHDPEKVLCIENGLVELSFYTSTSHKKLEFHALRNNEERVNVL